MSNKYESKLCLEFLYKITEKRKALCLNLKELNSIFENLMDEKTYNEYLKITFEKQSGFVKNFLIKELGKYKRVSKSNECKKIETLWRFL